MPRITITVPGKPAQPYQFEAGKDSVTIGRGSNNDIVIDCASISTRHAEISRSDGGYELRDLGSTNGIRRDGKRVEVTPLGADDRVNLGDVVLEFVATPAEAAAPSVAAATPLPPLADPTPEATSAEEQPPGIDVATVAEPPHAEAVKTPPAPAASPAQQPRLFGPIVFAIAGIAVVMAAAFGVEQQSGETNDLRIFLGRFHPLVVHFPIALLVLAAAFEWLGMMRPLSHLRRAVPTILVLGALGAAASVVHGVMLTSGAGAMGETTEDHLWAGVALSVAMFLLVPLRATTRETPRWLTGFCYQFVLIAALGLLVITSHLGGSITHGREYLVEYMPDGMRESLASLPEPVRDFIGLPTPAAPVAAVDLTLYDAIFAGPVARYCVDCHKPDRTRGGLLMHTLEALMEGGKSGPAIVLGSLEASELYTRITLPPDDDDFMPPDGKPGFSDTHVEWFRWWIASGIPGETPAADVADAPEDVLEAIQSAIEEANAAAAAAASAEEPAAADATSATAGSWTAEDIAAINATISGRILPVSRDSDDGLVLTTAGAGEAFTDADLDALAAVAPFIREADLARTGITDGGVAVVANWPALQRLRLDHTGIGDSGVASLGNHPTLESLNLYQTKITDASVPTLLAMPALNALFAGETALSDDALESLARLLPEIPAPPAEETDAADAD